MKTHNITVLDLEDFGINDFQLIGIQTFLPFHKIAYLLNQALGLYFEKKGKIDFLTLIVKGNESNYGIYEYSFIEESYWFLLENQNRNSNIQSFIVPEYSSLQYLIKLDVLPDHLTMSQLIEKIEAIPSVFDVFEIDLNQINSLQNLYF